MSSTYMAPNQVWRNDQGTFSEVSDSVLGGANVNHIVLLPADYNGDGLVDIFEGNEWFVANRLIRNMGNWTFEEDRNFDNSWSDPACMGATWGDIDRDGDVDLLIRNTMQTSELYLNKAGTLVKEHGTALTMHWGYGSWIEMVDLNGDNYLDVVWRDHWVTTRNFLNQPPGELARKPIPAWDMADVERIVLGDYDADGVLDALSVNWDGIALLKNDGSGSMTKVTGDATFAFDAVLTSTGDYPSMAWATFGWTSLSTAAWADYDQVSCCAKCATERHTHTHAERERESVQSLMIGL